MTLRLMSIVVLSGFACTAVHAAAPADAGVPSNEDLRHVRAMSEPKLSPDARRVLIKLTDATADGARSHLWLVEVASNSARQLTYSPSGDKAGEHGGQWLGDGSVVFLAKRGEHEQLFRLPMSGGEARAYDLKVAPPVDASAMADAVPPKNAEAVAGGRDPLPLEVEQIAAAPDGHAVAVVAPDPITPGEKKQKDEKADAVWLNHDVHGKRLYLLDPDSGKLTAVSVPPDVAAVAWAGHSD